MQAVDDRLTIRAAFVRGNSLELQSEDGGSLTFALGYLRDACTCMECRHAGSGQRLTSPALLAVAPAVERVLLTERGLEITWADNHLSRYPAAWFHRAPAADDAATTRWGAQLLIEPVTFSYDEVTAGESGRLAWLEAIERFGFALLQGVPSRAGELESVVALFGYVRETNYGRIFDVRAEVNPTNLAYTGLALGPHTDNPYREPPPGLQLLHCLASQVDGGRTTLVDGFHAAETLRRTDPAAFAILSSLPVRFRYAVPGVDLRAESPIIEIDDGGTVRAIRFNHRSWQSTPLPAAQWDEFARAYRSFVGIIEDPDLQLCFQLEPGEVLIMNNRRLLHGRTAFASSGTRHLQGCYADLDGLRSTLAVLRARNTIIEDLFSLFRARGDATYVGEPVSLTEHMVQSAQAAVEDGAPVQLVAAALLHDIGHLLHDEPETIAEQGIDTRHEDLGHVLLTRYFPPEVVEPVRLHVAAKRYLCAVDPAYRAALSPASELSLQLQGGPMSAAEVEAFARSPHAEAAVRLRRFDDVAKEPEHETPPLDRFRPMLEATLIAP